MSAHLILVLLIAVTLVAASALVLIAVLTGPDWVTAGALGLLFSNVMVWAGSQGLPGAGLLPYLVLCIPAAYQILVGGRRVVWGWPSTAMLVFASVALISTILAPVPEASISTVVQWAFEGVIFLIAATNAIRSESVLRRCVQAIVLAGAIIGLIGLRQHLSGNYAQTYFGLAQVSAPYDLTGGGSPLDDGSETGDYRLAGMIGEPNFFAMAMAALVPWAIYLVYTERNRWLKLGWIASTLLILEAVVLSYSRGAQVALASIAFLALLVGVIKLRWLLMVPVGIAFLLVTNPTSAERFLTLVGITSASPSSGGDASTQGRFTEVLSALLVYSDYPILGVGPGQFPSYFQRYAAQLGAGNVHVGDGDRNAHNLVAGMAADVGTIGLLAFGALFVTVLVGLYWARFDPDLRPAATAAIASLLIYLACSVFLHLAYARYLWLYLALGAAIVAIERARRSAQLSASRVAASSSERVKTAEALA